MHELSRFVGKSISAFLASHMLVCGRSRRPKFAVHRCRISPPSSGAPTVVEGRIGLSRTGFGTGPGQFPQARARAARLVPRPGLTRLCHFCHSAQSRAESNSNSVRVRSTIYLGRFCSSLVGDVPRLRCPVTQCPTQYSQPQKIKITKHNNK